MQENTILANEKERETYSNILRKRRDRTRVHITQTDHRIKLANRSVFKICEMGYKVPEEEVLFLYNQPKKEQPFSQPKEESLLIPRYVQHEWPPKCDPVEIFYLLCDVILLAYSIFISIHLGILYHQWLNIKFSAYVFLTIILIVGLFTCSIIGMTCYFTRVGEKDKINMAFYGLLIFDILLTIVNLITVNLRGGIVNDVYWYLDYRKAGIFTLYGTLLFFEIVVGILHHFFIKNNQKHYYQVKYN